MGVSTSPATGARGAVRIGEESVYGVAVEPTHILDFTSESIAATENIIESESIREDRGRHKLIRGNLDVGGDIAFEQSADGYGMLMRHALGDYVRVPGADGGIRGRAATVAMEEAAADPDGATSGYLLEFTAEQAGDFANAARKIAVVYRDASNSLVAANNANAGYSYTEYAGREQTYVISVLDTSKAWGGGAQTNSAVAVTVADVVDADGNLVAPDFNPNGGILYASDGRIRHRYFEYTAGTGGGSNDSVLYIEPSTTDVGAVVSHAGSNPAANDAAIGAPCLAHTSTMNLPAAAGKGTFIYEFDPTWMTSEFGGSGDDTVFTHHLERGRELPTGLTVEINRDAAIFVYSGMKASTLSLTFDANAIVTGTMTLAGKQEYAMAELVGDVVPGAETIVIDDRTTFPDSGILTIGEETQIAYTAIAANGDNWDVTIQDANQIERFHPKGQNVDSRTSTEANIYEADYNNEAVSNFEVGEVLTFDGASATAELLVLSDAGATGSIIYRMISGDAPANGEGITGGTSGTTADLNSAPLELTPYEGNQSPLTAFETLVYLDGDFEEVLNGSITLNNNLNGDKFGLGSRFRLQLVAEQAVVEASLTMEFDDGKNYKKFISGDFFSLEFKAISESDDSEIGSTGVLSGAYYFIPKCKYTGTTPQIASTSFIQHDMPVTCIVDDDNNTTDIVIVLVNANENDVSVAGT